MDINKLLSYALESGASDLHLSSGSIPMVRINGIMKPLNMSATSDEDMSSILPQVMNDDQIENFHNNLDVETLSWWRPQVDFLTENTHLWKFEKGLGTDFGDWVSEKLGVPFEIDPYVNYATNDYEGFKLDKSDKLIQNIRKFCSQDIEQLYPELK